MDTNLTILRALMTKFWMTIYHRLPSMLAEWRVVVAAVEGAAAGFTGLVRPDFFLCRTAETPPRHPGFFIVLHIGLRQRDCERTKT